MRSFNFLFALGKTTELTATTFFGEPMSVVLPSGYGEIYLYGAPLDADAEVRLNMFLVRELAEGGTFFDIGACLGYYSLLASELVGARGAVHAFEPAPPLLPLLRRNLDGRPNITLVTKAMSGRSGTVQFHVAPLPFIGTSSIRADWQTKTELATVETTSLDDYCYGAGVFPDIIKLDVEGVEDAVLGGADKLLTDKAPVIVLEVFTPLIDSDRKAMALLRKHGYAPHAILDDGRLRLLNDETLEAHLAVLKARYRVVQDSVNDFDNMVFKRVSPGEGGARLLS